MVSPLRSMLDDVRTEMSKLGVPLAILRGGAVEQQATLRAWQTGGFKGLLSDPEIPGLNLSEASAVVFLSPMLTDTQFTQAAGRVVRQGSHHTSARVIVLGAAQSAETENAAAGSAAGAGEAAGIVPGGGLGPVDARGTGHAHRPPAPTVRSRFRASPGSGLYR